MDAFIGQRFEDFETIAGVNVIKLYGDYLLPARIEKNQSEKYSSGS